MKKLTIIVLGAVVFLAGCNSTQYFRRMSDYELCKSYLNAASYNIHQDTRYAELQRRGQDCNGFVNLD